MVNGVQQRGEPLEIKDEWTAWHYYVGSAALITIVGFTIIFGQARQDLREWNSPALTCLTSPLMANLVSRFESLTNIRYIPFLPFPFEGTDRGPFNYTVEDFRQGQSYLSKLDDSVTTQFRVFSANQILLEMAKEMYRCNRFLNRTWAQMVILDSLESVERSFKSLL
jgi:hypothetical protein